TGPRRAASAARRAGGDRHPLVAGGDAMRSQVVGAAKLVAVSTVVLVFVAAFAPGRAGLAVRIYALVVCGALVVAALNALRQACPPETPVRTPRRRTPSRRNAPPSLARLETLAALGVASSFDLQYRFLPRLRAVTAGLLTPRRQVDLEASPESANDLL